MGIVLLKNLNHILHCRWTYVLLVLAAIIYSLISLQLPHPSKLDISENRLIGKITSIKIEGNLLTLEIKNQEKVLGNYYFKSKQEKEDFQNQYHLGDTIDVTGTFSLPKNNTVPNLFNYRKYLEQKNIHYLLSIDTIQRIRKNQNLFYSIIRVILKGLFSSPFPLVIFTLDFK